MIEYMQNEVAIQRTLSEERRIFRAQMSDPHFCGGTITRIHDSHFCGYGPSDEQMEIIRNRGW